MDDGQYLQGENDFFYQVGIKQHGRGRAIYGFGKKIECRHAAEHGCGETAGTTFGHTAPAGLEDDPEYKGVDEQHHERLCQAPEPAEDGSFITQCQLTAGHMQDQGRIARKDPAEEEWMP